MRIETITDSDQLRALHPQWNALLGGLRPRPLPLTHQWVSAWWRNFGAGHRLSVVCAYDGERLVGLAPFIEGTRVMRGIRVTCRQLMSNAATPFCGLVLDRDMSPALLHELLDALITGCSQEVLVFSRLPRRDPVFDAILTRLVDSRRRFGVKTSIATPIVETQGAWSEFLATRSKKFRKSLRHRMNRAERAGFSVQHELIESRDHPTVADLIAVSAKSWKASKGTDLAADSASRRFLLDLFDSFGPEGAVHVWIARDGRVPIAFELHIILDGVAYPLRADFDPGYGTFSPGSVVEASALKTLFDCEDTRVYYSCADNFAYLSHWSEARRDHADIEIYRGGLKAALVHLTEYTLVPALKALRGRR